MPGALRSRGPYAREEETFLDLLISNGLVRMCGPPLAEPLELQLASFEVALVMRTLLAASGDWPGDLRATAVARPRWTSALPKPPGRRAARTSGH